MGTIVKVALGVIARGLILAGVGAGLCLLVASTTA
jgi:hypothetical protein